MKLRTTTLILAAAASLLAQGPRPAAPPQPAIDAIRTYLNLTDAEVQALGQIQQQESQAERTAMDKMRQDQNSLQNLLQSNTGDAATLGNLLLDIQSQQASIAKQRTTFAPQAANVLTADQKTKLQALTAAQQLAPAIQQAIGLLLLAPPANRLAGPNGGPMRGVDPALFGRHGFRPPPER